MTTAWSIGGILTIVAAILLANRRPSLQRLFHWLPVPLWCYTLPMVAVSLGVIPPGTAAYRALTEALLPVALVLLLLGTDLPAVSRAGAQALAAAIVGSLGVVLGAALGVSLLRGWLPADAWKGAGALTGTWTGGSMNLLALRSVLNIPDAIFAPLIVTDAVIAYSWMALLVAASAVQDPLNAWLRATVKTAEPLTAHEQTLRAPTRGALVACGVLALLLALGARMMAPKLPVSNLVNSSSGWMVLLVTTASLALSLVPSVRRYGAAGGTLGYPCLYMVLAAMGAQASLRALQAAPMWIVLGLVVVVIHGTLLLLFGRWWKIPLGMLATASQANIGGVVSAPLVGAVYHRSLAPVGLLLAMAGNALGTYVGLWAAGLSHGLSSLSLTP